MINISQTNSKPLSNDDNMIPLINIVFLMLVFFMVAGHIKATDELNIEPPESYSDAEPRVEAILLVVDGLGELTLSESPVTIDNIERELQALLVASELPNSLHLEIHVDSNYPAVSLKAILLRIKASGFRNVSLATTLKNS